MINKEYGSDFHYINNDSFDGQNFLDQKNIFLFFSGRVALFNLLKFGIEKFGWNKVGFPSYYCHEVVLFCEKLPVKITYYDYSPFKKQKKIEWEDHEKSVFINVDFFGVDKIDTSFLKKSVIIDDLTHNILSITDSKANYCFGSLRKQLPVGVGGFCLGKNEDVKLMLTTNLFADKIAQQKMTAMYLKSEYLQGNFTQKDIFRNLYIEAENQFESEHTNAKIPKLIKAQLFSFDINKLIEKTRSNIKTAKEQLQLKDCKILESVSDSEFGLIFVFNEESLRDKFRFYLIENAIFPAILWPSQTKENDIFYQNRMLFIHLDFRYNQVDVLSMISTINIFFRDV